LDQILTPTKPKGQSSKRQRRPEKYLSLLNSILKFSFKIQANPRRGNEPVSLPPGPLREFIHSLRNPQGSQAGAKTGAKTDLTFEDVYNRRNLNTPRSTAMHSATFKILGFFPSPRFRSSIVFRAPNLSSAFFVVLAGGILP
jgi:hypothetical protein